MAFEISRKINDEIINRATPGEKKGPFLKYGSISRTKTKTKSKTRTEAFALSEGRRIHDESDDYVLICEEPRPKVADPG